MCVDAPPDEHFSIMPSDLDAVTDRRRSPSSRLHGRNTDGYLKGKSVAERFAWRYEDDELEEIAGRARALAEQAREVHVAFNNNRGDDAPTAAQRFRALLGQAPAGGGAAAGSSRGAARTRRAWRRRSGSTPQRCASRSTRNRPQPLSFGARLAGVGRDRSPGPRR